MPCHISFSNFTATEKAQKCEKRQNILMGHHFKAIARYATKKRIFYVFPQGKKLYARIVARWNAIDYYGFSSNQKQISLKDTIKKYCMLRLKDALRGV